MLANRMTLREGPQALDAQRLGRAAEALHIALLQSAPTEPRGEPVIRLFAARPKDWNGSFQLLAQCGFLVQTRFGNGAVAQVQLRSLAGGGMPNREPLAGNTAHRLSPIA